MTNQQKRSKLANTIINNAKDLDAVIRCMDMCGYKDLLDMMMNEGRTLQDAVRTIFTFSVPSDHLKECDYFVHLCFD